MEVTALGATSTEKTETSAPANVKTGNSYSDLGQDAFLQLLLTQLQYQDPMNPMNDTEFVAQLAQFTTLSEIQKLNATANELLTAQGLSSAASLIGLTVTGLDDDDSSITGVVQSALMKDSKVYVRVGDTDVALANVNLVTYGGTDE